MILVDNPYVSAFLKETIIKNGYPVVKTKAAIDLGFDGRANLLDEDLAIQHINTTEQPLVYTSSENALDWIAQNLGFSELPEKIALFKDKAKFRRLTEPLFPDFFYQEVSLVDLDRLTIEGIPFPFIVKPAVGFFSLGVHKISSDREWRKTKETLQDEIHQVNALYPKGVLDTTRFIIEQHIDGDEYAVDAYFNAQGTPVITNILKHIFSSGDDVSDRVYFSSKEIIEDNLEKMTSFLYEIGRLAGLTNFPVHVEVRIDSRGHLLPVEINPLRFGGWCTTADMTYYAYGFNPYEYYFSQSQPDWTRILKDKGGKLFSIIVLDNTTGVEGKNITSFDYQKLLSTFEKPLDLRKIDYKEHPVFGFLFTETKEEHFSELEFILGSDLKEYIQTSESR